MAQIKIETTDAVKEKLKQTANEQGLTLTTQCRRVLLLYLQNPGEFEKLAAYIKLKQQKALTEPSH